MTSTTNVLSTFQMGVAAVAVAATVAAVTPAVAPQLARADIPAAAAGALEQICGTDPGPCVPLGSANATAAPTIPEILTYTIQGIVDGLRIGIGTPVWGAVALTGAVLTTLGFLPLIGPFLETLGTTVDGIAAAIGQALRVGPYLEV